MARGMVLLGAVVAMLACASPASAWWAEGSNVRAGAFGVVELTALPGEVNDVTVTPLEGGRLASGLAPAGSVLIHDASAPFTPPPEGRGQGCTQVDANTVRCTGIGAYQPETDTVDYLQTDLGDGDDRLTVLPTSQGVTIVGYAGPGDDTITNASLGGASFSGGDGNDRITIRGTSGGWPGGSGVAGDAGNDVLDVANIDDNRPNCGAGYDLVYADANDEPFAADCEDYRVVQPVKRPSISF